MLIPYSLLPLKLSPCLCQWGFPWEQPLHPKWDYMEFPLPEFLFSPPILPSSPSRNKHSMHSESKKKSSYWCNIISFYQSMACFHSQTEQGFLFRQHAQWQTLHFWLFQLIISCCFWSLIQWVVRMNTCFTILIGPSNNSSRWKSFSLADREVFSDSTLACYQPHRL